MHVFIMMLQWLSWWSVRLGVEGKLLVRDSTPADRVTG